MINKAPKAQPDAGPSREETRFAGPPGPPVVCSKTLRKVQVRTREPSQADRALC